MTNGKRNEDFKNNDGLDKADSFKKINYFRQTEDLKGSDSNFKKNDDPEKNGNPELISSAEIMGICEMMRNPEPGKCSAPIIEPELEEEEPSDDSGDISVPWSVLVFRAGRGVAGELLIDPGQRSPGLMRSFVLRSPGLKSFPSLVRSPGLMRSPILRSPVLRSSGLMRSFGLKRSSGLMRSPVLRSPRLMRSTELMRYPVLRAPILRPPVPRPPDLMRSPDLMGSPDLMRSSDLDRSPGLMRSLVLKADSTCTSPLMRSPVLSSPVPRSPVLYLYLEKFSDLSGVKELVSRPMIGMKFSRLRNMTAMGVQVVGTLLNKTISTGDDWWGERWNLIQESLRCYALGDIQFGFMTYNILSGLMLRDVFPDPEVLCRYLKCNQKEAADWFLEFLMVSLEGVEYQQKAEEEAETREEMILSLRYRDEREKLCEFSPPWCSCGPGS